MTSETNTSSEATNSGSQNAELEKNKGIPGNDKIFVFSPAIGMFFLLASLAMLAILIQHFSGVVKKSHNAMNFAFLVGGLGGMAYFWFLYSIRGVIVSIFSSLKATAVLLGMILLASMIGTFIIQGMTFPEFIKFFSAFFKWLGVSNDASSFRYGKYLAQFSYKLYLTDIYHCLWFNSWLLVLAVNLCYSTTKNGKWVFHKLGFTLTHVGFIVILLGGLVTGLFGVRGQVQLTEGETKNHYVHERTGEAIPIGFSIKLNKFTFEKWKPKRRLLSVRLDEKGFPKINKAGSDYLYGKLVKEAQEKDEAVIKKDQLIKISAEAIKKRLKKVGKTEDEIANLDIKDVEIKILEFNDDAFAKRKATLIFGRFKKNSPGETEETKIPFPSGDTFELKKWGIKGKILSRDVDNPEIILQMGNEKEERQLIRGTPDQHLEDLKNRKIPVAIFYIPPKNLGSVKIEMTCGDKISTHTLLDLASGAPFSRGIATIPGTNETIIYNAYLAPKIYRSDILHNANGGEMRHEHLGQSGKADEFNKKQGRGASVILNEPIKAGRFLVYQISYNENEETGKYTSVLLLVDEPGGWLLTAGCYIVLLGMIWMLWIEPFYRRKEKQKKLEALASKGGE